MRSGLLRHRLTFQTKSASRDAYGGEDATWSDDETRWGSVSPLRGQEYFAAQQVHAEATHKIIIRHYEGLTIRHRIKFDTRYFNIESIRNIDERGIMMELICNEMV